MDNKSNHQDDLAGIKGMPLHPRDLPHMVPSNYFDRLESNILQRVQVIVETEKAFAVPSTYFDTLAQRIVDRVEAEQDAEVSIDSVAGPATPFLEKLKEIAPAAGYAVPVNYFEKLSTDLQQTVANSSSDAGEEAMPTVISLQRHKGKSMSWIRYLSAACIMIALGTYTFLQMRTSTATGTTSIFEKKLNAIPEGEIVSYLQYFSEPGDDAMFEVQFNEAHPIDNSTLSEEDIEAYLDYSI